MNEIPPASSIESEQSGAKLRGPVDAPQQQTPATPLIHDCAVLVNFQRYVIAIS